MVKAQAKGTQRDVKNEDRSDYVYENKGKHDKMTGDLPGFFTKMHRLRAKGRQSSRLFGGKCISFGINRGTTRHDLKKFEFRSSGSGQEGSESHIPSHKSRVP